MLDKVPVTIVFDDGRVVECSSVLEAAKTLGVTSTMVSILLRASREGYRVIHKEKNNVK